MDAYIVMPKIKRTIMLAFFSFVFVSIGILILALSINGQFEGILPASIGIITITVFGLCFIYYINVLIKREPAVIVTNEGIIDQSSYIGAGLVKWKEIEAIDLINFSGQVYLGIFTFDGELIINRSNGMKRVLNVLNKGLLPSQVNIPVKNLACSIEDLFEAIGERWEMALKEEG
ncbi:hypothetical protein D4T97_005665 [Siminovitchia acidinfaciens]|uniref:PH domain-containing protein n=1 Tax=Siminovitchia acidinfaciens TaxID=2321395 RepID=A0A429Y4C5_9BACI|nr:STM3941 family protein [Siminovitchia acidinfaciens]RST76263.1 hypothetical protein D4T97_005665 [Siminovitchia acidinfaciens]